MIKRRKRNAHSWIRYNRSDRLVRKKIQQHWSDDRYTVWKLLYGWPRKGEGQRKSRIKQRLRFYKYCLVNAKHLFDEILDSQIRRAREK